MDEPYDWELGYENLSGRGKANGNISARMKSHTTAVIRDHRYEDKNRWAMQTQFRTPNSDSSQFFEAVRKTARSTSHPLKSNR